MKQSNIFWGGLLVSLGALFILKNIGLVYFNWLSIFSLWPMLLVLIGLTMLPIKNGIKTLLTIVLLVVTVTLIFTKTNHWNRSYSFQFDKWDRWEDELFEDDRTEDSEHYFYEPYDSDIKEATITIDAVAGDFLVREQSKHLMEFFQDGNIGPYIFSTNKNGDHQTLILDIKHRHFKRRGLNNDVEIQLNETPLWNFNINAGAASVDLDLSNFKTRFIDIDGGASSVDIRLGDKFNKSEINIDSGVSSIKIYIPEDSGCEIDTDTFLASKRFSGFDKLKRGLYQTPNFEVSENRIYINIDAAITSLEVVRY